MLNLVYKVTKLIAFIIVHLVGWQNTNIPIIVYICPIGFKISSEKPECWLHCNKAIQTNLIKIMPFLKWII